MANVNDVRRVKDQADKERRKLADPADVTGGVATLTGPGGDEVVEVDGDPARVAEADREALVDFANHLKRRVAESTYRSYLSDLRVSAVRTDTPLIEYDGVTDVDALVADHEAAGCKSAGGLNSHLSALRKFLEWLDGVDEHGHDDYRFRKLIENVQPNGTNDGADPVDPEFVFSSDEVTAMTEAATNPRDAALIQFLADAGPRISLALQIKRGDVDVPAGEPGTFRPNPDAVGHKDVPNERYRLHESRRHLRVWLNEYHPDDHPDAPLFTKMRGYDPDDRENGAIHPATAETALERAAERAGIDTDRAHPHNFRKTAVTRMRVKHDMSWDAIQHRTGWSDTSLAEMKEIYRRIDEDERLAIVDRELGNETDDEDTPAPTPEPCANCGRELDPDWNVCPGCGADPDADPTGGSLEALVDERVRERNPDADEDEIQRRKQAAMRGMVDRLMNSGAASGTPPADEWPDE